jgi:hypothetical protein
LREAVPQKGAGPGAVIACYPGSVSAKFYARTAFDDAVALVRTALGQNALTGAERLTIITLILYDHHLGIHSLSASWLRPNGLTSSKIPQ